MKVRKVFICLFIIMLGCAVSASDRVVQKNQGSVETSMRLTVDGIFLVNNQGDRIVLKGVSYGWHNWCPRFYNTFSVDYLAKFWNCSIVRAAIGVEPDGAYIQDPKKGLSCAQTIADAAIENGIYVIVDWHSHNIRLKEAKEFFRKMAIRYRGIPNVIYEIYNEPVEDRWKIVKSYSEEIIKTIRSIEPDALILVGSPHWDQDIHLVADDPITGYKNIMYTLHFYANTHGQNLRDRADYALSKGLPLFVSECAGMEASGKGAINRSEWNKWQIWMQQHLISWVAWSITDKNETCSMILSSASSEGNWDDDSLKEWGMIVREELCK